MGTVIISCSMLSQKFIILNVHVKDFFLYLLPSNSYQVLISYVLQCFRYATKTNLTGFCGSSQLRVADFSYNFFVGSIPKCLEHLPGYLLCSLSCS